MEKMIEQMRNEIQRDLEIDGKDIDTICRILAVKGYTKQEWISVDERLPEDKQRCLIFTTIYFTPDHIGDCDHYDGIEISSFYTDMGFVSNNGFYAKYWMPLPPKPKMKGAE